MNLAFITPRSLHTPTPTPQVYPTLLIPDAQVLGAHGSCCIAYIYLGETESSSLLPYPDLRGTSLITFPLRALLLDNIHQ